MIPRTIHYCWFGRNPLPKTALRCIDSWKKFFPDFVIKEWNESNFDVNMIPYTREAYNIGKYAFVSDVARFWILYNEGGLYFDTDVEVINSFEDIISKGAFMGVEIPSFEGSYPAVNPGLGLGAEAGNVVVKKILDYYNTLHFINENGAIIPGTVVTHTTNVLASSFHLKPTNAVQILGFITIFPVDYFNPFDDVTGKMNITPNTRSIHWFSKSWINKPSWYFKITRILHRFLGVASFGRLKSLLRLR